MTHAIRTRFAPSPTGHVHIGNMRAAIYNWLFARHGGGAFLLRLEDTDRERSTPEAVDTVFDALAWLGLDHDEEPVYQSARRDAHRDAADTLLARGLAYRSDKGGTGRGEAIVFRMPDREMSFQDEIKGPLRKSAEDLQDLVIVRSDGTPVFHLANVLDDIEMGITHVIRGDDHIENTYRHIALYRALDAPVPRFAHLPMIVNRQGKPYAKRDGAAFVGEFRAAGYLPQVLLNYLALLGWSPGDDREILSREEMIECFTLDRVNSSAAQMDLKKLEWMNGEYIRALPPERFARQAQDALTACGLWHEGIHAGYLRRVAALMQARTKRLAEFPQQAIYFFSEEYPFDEKAVRKRLRKEGALARLASLKERYAVLDPFHAAAAESALRDLAEDMGVEAGQLVHPLRVAVSGQAGGPGLFEMLELLGRDRVVARIERAIEYCAGAAGDGPPAH